MVGSLKTHGLESACLIKTAALMSALVLVSAIVGISRATTFQRHQKSWSKTSRETSATSFPMV